MDKHETNVEGKAMKVAVLGRTQLLYESAKAISSNGHQIVLIGTCPAVAEYKKNENDFAELAETLRVPYFCDAAINSDRIIKLIYDSGADVAISVNWLTLISRKVIDQFPYGIINAHAGDLPRYRGNAVSNWAIINNEATVVLTLHYMVAELDAGPILLQRTFHLLPTTYITDIYSFIEVTLPGMFVETLDGLESNSLFPRNQSTDPSQSLRCFPRLPRDSELDWDQSAEYLARLIRASAEPFAGAYSYLNKEKLIIWRAYADRLPYPYLGAPGQVAERRKKKGEVIVLTGDGVLVLQEAENAFGVRSSAGEIITSSRVRLGVDTHSEIVQLRKEIERLKQIIESGALSK
jgi:methionyl-tRNA formyltransferase